MLFDDLFEDFKVVFSFVCVRVVNVWDEECDTDALATSAFTFFRPDILVDEFKNSWLDVSRVQ